MLPAVALGNRREVCWDEHLIDAPRTTATLTLHRPRAEEVVLVHDEPWEGDGCDTTASWPTTACAASTTWAGTPATRARPRPFGPITVCYAESRDGRHWEKPRLGLCEFNGSRDNCRFSPAFGPGWHSLSVPPYDRLLLNAAHLQKAGSEARADLMFGKRVYSTVMLDPGS